MIKHISKSWKTTVLGLIIIIATLVSIFVIPGITWWPEGFVGVALGVVLWFSPDTLIEAFSKFIGNNKAESTNDTETENKGSTE